MKIFGSSTVGSCGKVGLYAYVSGLGGRAGTWSWSSDTIDLSSVDTTGRKLILFPGQVAPGTHTFTLQVTNFVRQVGLGGALVFCVLFCSG